MSIKLTFIFLCFMLMSCQATQKNHTNDKIKEVIKLSQPEILTCWESYIDKNKEVTKGKVMSEWVIHKDGSVHDVKIKENTLEVKDEVFETCLVQILQNMKFTDHYIPKGEEAHVTFPFLFSVKN